MQWYYLSFLSPLLWSISNHIDKYVLSRYLKSAKSGVLAIYTGIAGFLFSLCILAYSPSAALGISLSHAIIIVLNGALLIIAFVPYYFALNDEDTSTVVPIYQSIPIFSFAIAFVLLGETINTLQIVAGLCIIVGSVLISLDLERSGFHLKIRSLLLMLLASFLIAIHFVIFKVIAIQETFWRTAFWEYLGAALVAVILLFFTKYREEFIAVLRENSLGVILANVVNEIINIAAKLLANYASLLVPIVVVNLANGLQPLFVFLIGLFLTLLLPSISKEKISRKYIVQKVLAIVVLSVGTYLLVT